ncbi:MAG: site-specific integrase [Desertifilum sp. SIO1I2]|nr:site-specific integrase [Desertifilum sp. SIO1I2]
MDKLKQANSRLKSAKVGCSLMARGDRLYLRATLPPKPGNSSKGWHQQTISTGIHANPGGIKEAEKLAKLVGAQLDCNQFEWENYLRHQPRAKPQLIRDWVEIFERDYWQRRLKTPESETTWRTDYHNVFKRLPLDEPLTLGVLEDAITAIPPDTRQGRRFCIALSLLAKLAGLDPNFKGLKGKYSINKAVQRTLPTDEMIETTFNRLPPGHWQWTFGMMAAYGLRNHEIFFLDFSEFPGVYVVRGKTKNRIVYPLYPEWAESWCLDKVQIPPCTGRNNADLGNRVIQPIDNRSHCPSMAQVIRRKRNV